MNAIRSRPVVAAVALVGLLALAGCIQFGVHSTVAADGTIEEYELQMNLSRTAYGYLEQSAEDQGYDSVEEYMLSGSDGGLAGEASDGSPLAGVNQSQAEVRYEETFRGDRVTISFIAESFEPTDDGPISIARNGSRLVYEDLTFYNESALAEMEESEQPQVGESVTAGFAVDYRLTMPGEIVDSNADEVDGNTAVWHESGMDAFVDNRIYAESEVPTETSLPGFGVSAALVALLLVSAVGAATARLRSRP